jgi:hypothetical protein
MGGGGKGSSLLLLLLLLLILLYDTVHCYDMIDSREQQQLQREVEEDFRLSLCSDHHLQSESYKRHRRRRYSHQRLV